MLEQAYFNFFALGSLIPAVFVALAAMFLWQIRERSHSTLMLAIAFSTMLLFYLPYFPSALFYESSMAYHRWFTVAFVLTAGSFFAQFMFAFPALTQPRLAKGFLFGMLGIAILWTGVFVYATLNAPRVYHFDGHYWDFDVERMSALTGLLIFVLCLAVIVIGLWRSFKVERGYRLPLAAMALSFAFITIVPGITNVMSREGAIDRGLHQSLINFCVITGFFSILVIYINSTQDRTTFMGKIVGVSLAVMLLMLQFINYLTTSDRESAYDEMRRRDVELAAVANARPDGLLYLIRFPLNGAGAAETLVGDQTQVLDLETARADASNSSLRARIAALDALDPAQFPDALEQLLAAAPPTFAGHAAFLRAKAPAQIGEAPASSLLAEVDANARAILRESIKIRALPDEGFRAALEKRLAGSGPALLPYRTAIEAALKSDAREGAPLKRHVLELLRPLKAAGARLYRHPEGPSAEGDRYVAFQWVDLERGAVYEGGFSYLGYRSFISESSRKLFYVLGVVLAVTLFGFRVFFLGALVRPLEALLRGVGKVNEGDLSVEVPIKVDDEIGYLSRSFNSMVASIRHAQARLKEYADHLEEKVTQRTQELKSTLDQVQALKQQQDGDYFLTSLLIKPLNVNRTENERVAVDFLLKQKKQFEFRQRNSEIGGDICMARHIALRGRNYTVFLNADAMGKSMQGASGALVLGSVFESIITRTRLSSEARSIYPERWLKNAFIELHKVFESFDGCMLISLVAGLIDESNGFVYYVNAEHPFTVLYRNGRAGFIEEELTFRKLGTSGMQGELFVSTFQLRPGDVLIAGSDGRDDILLGVDETSGDRIINEDENRFLMVVEEANADLDRIQVLLESMGQLTDDLSLLRVVYTGEELNLERDTELAREALAEARRFAREGDWAGAVRTLQAAQNIMPENLRILRELAGALYKQRNYAHASRAFSAYMDLNPGDTEMIYIASVVEKKLRNYELSADLGERVRVREPGHVKNLVHLADIYLRLKAPERAMKLLHTAMERDPSYGPARKLKQALEGVSSRADPSSV